MGPLGEQQRDDADDATPGAAATSAASSPASETAAERELRELRELTAAWDRAVVARDVAAIDALLADEWFVVDADGTVARKEAFLALLRSGDLVQDVARTHDLVVRVDGRTAVTVARGVSDGRLHGTPFRREQRVSRVFVRRDGAWRCVLTHLSPLGPRAGGA
jgi:ketosteroid isomerase-like protein